MRKIPPRGLISNEAQCLLANAKQRKLSSTFPSLRCSLKHFQIRTNKNDISASSPLKEIEVLHHLYLIKIPRQCRGMGEGQGGSAFCGMEDQVSGWWSALGRITHGGEEPSTLCPGCLHSGDDSRQLQLSDRGTSNCTVLTVKSYELKIIMHTPQLGYSRMTRIGAHVNCSTPSTLTWNIHLMAKWMKGVVSALAFPLVSLAPSCKPEVFWNTSYAQGLLQSCDKTVRYILLLAPVLNEEPKT